MSALPAAVAFALAVNLMLVTRYIYPQWMSGALVSMSFWVGVLVWGLLVVRNIRELPQIVSPRTVSEEPDRYPEAHLAYLKADYKTAERLLNEVLAIESRDPPSLLLLCSIYRHTDRFESAELLLQEASRLEVCDGWRLEIHAEAKRLQAAIERAEAAKAESGEKGDTESEAKAAPETRVAATGSALAR